MTRIEEAEFLFANKLKAIELGWITFEISDLEAHCQRSQGRTLKDLAMRAVRMNLDRPFHVYLDKNRVLHFYQQPPAGAFGLPGASFFPPVEQRAVLISKSYQSKDSINDEASVSL